MPPEVSVVVSAGGLVGVNGNGGTIENSYATGSVSGGSGGWESAALLV